MATPLSISVMLTIEANAATARYYIALQSAMAHLAHGRRRRAMRCRFLVSYDHIVGVSVPTDRLPVRYNADILKQSSRQILLTHRKQRFEASTVSLSAAAASNGLVSLLSKAKEPSHR